MLKPPSRRAKASSYSNPVHVRATAVVPPVVAGTSQATDTLFGKQNTIVFEKPVSLPGSSTAEGLLPGRLTGCTAFKWRRKGIAWRTP